MKVAVLADIHANLPALQSVVAHIDQWQPDCVVVAGDIVNRGPSPLACWQRVAQYRQEGKDGQRVPWHILKGNHEEYVISHTHPHPPWNPAQAEIFRGSEWTYEQLGPSIVAELDALPLAFELDEQAHCLEVNSASANAIARFTHGSMRGTRDGIYTRTSEADLWLQMGANPPPLFCVGHTHQPLIRQLGSHVIVNVGSVGMPFDGDWHAAYAQLVWQHHQWQTEIIRLPYDRAQTERDYIDTGFLTHAGALTKLMLRELRVARGQLYTWSQEYEARTLADELTVAQSVDEYLQRH